MKVFMQILIMQFITNLFLALLRTVRKLRFVLFRLALKMILGSLGNGGYIYPGVVIRSPKNVFIGDDVSIAPGVVIDASPKGSVSIGDRCAIAAGTRIVTYSHDPEVLPVSRVSIYKSVKIGNDVWIGTAVVILPGVTIHDGAIVAAGAVVTRDVEPDFMVAGVPARKVKQLDSRENRFDNGEQ